MSTGPQHYALAEQILDKPLADVVSLARAQVHAILALAAATAMAADRQGMSSLDFEAWDAVAGVQEADDEDEDYRLTDGSSLLDGNWAFAPDALAGTPLAVAFGAALPVEPDDDLYESEAEWAAEGRATAMSASELYEADRDAEFAQDAADEERWAAEAEAEGGDA